MFDPNKVTFFAKTDARGANTPFGIKAQDRTRHMYVIGKTGMGKSTLLENMAVQDIKNGEGLAFIDPHGATAETLLDYIPEERKKDVLYFAPFDTENPVAFNVMEDVGPEKRHLVVSGLMSVFKKIWVDAWSARMEYILQNTLLALLEYPDSTLLGVNRMLSDKHYRRKVIDNISDPAVKSFWEDEFLNYNERYMQEAGDAIKNKIGQFTANPIIRNIIGQPRSSFDLRKIMDEKKIVIMNLSKGLVGESNANLLGSMLTTRIYLAAMSRADMSAAEMKAAPNFYFYVDEFQSFANATFADILSEARKYKLNLTIAHQYIEQMEEEVRNAVFGNVGTIISFRVGPFDAEVLETIFAPQFYAVDICNLGFAQIYLTLMIDGIGSHPFSAVTLPPIEPPQVSCKNMAVHASREQFSHPRPEVEATILAWHQEEHAAISGKQKNESNGDTRRDQNKKKKTYNNNNSNNNDNNTNTNISTNTSRTEPREKIRERQTKPQTERSKENNLSELRAVLAHIAKDTGGDGQKHGGERDAKKTDQNQHVPQGTKEQQNDTKKKDATDELKAALSGVLHNNPTTPPPEKMNEKTHTGQNESQAAPRNNTNQHIELAKQVAEEAPTQQKVKDPIDPKLLERMMRPKSSDKSPLK